MAVFAPVKLSLGDFCWLLKDILSGYPLVNYHSYGKSPFLIGTPLTISMAMLNDLNRDVKLPVGI